MNKDIRLSVGFFDHPKIIKLERKLGLEGITALLRLWIWAAQNRPSGILSGMDNDDIEIVARWNGVANEFNAVTRELKCKYPYQIMCAKDFTAVDLLSLKLIHFMINELRRIGGLLKHNFTILREANAPQECFDRQEHALQELVKAMGKFGTNDENSKLP